MTAKNTKKVKMKSKTWRVVWGILILTILFLISPALGWGTIGFGITLIPLHYLLRFVLPLMADINLFFTFRTEGEIKAKIKGEKGVEYIMAIEHYFIDPWDFDIIKGDIDSGSIKHFTKELAKVAAKRKAADSGFNDLKLKELPKKPSDEEKLAMPFPTEEGVGINKDKWYTLSDKFAEDLIRANRPTTFLERWYGVVWVGLPPYKIFTYQFRWIKFGQTRAQDNREAPAQPSSRVGMTPRDELVDSLYFRYTSYGIDMTGVETGSGLRLVTALRQNKLPGIQEGRIKVRIQLVMETVTKNPHKTLFRTAGFSSAGEWLQALTRAVQSEMRAWAGEVTYDTLSGNRTAVINELDAIRRRINKGVVIKGEYISAIDDYGQEIVKIEMVDIDLEDLDLQKAMDQIFVAEQKRRSAELNKLATFEEAEGVRRLAAAPILGESDGYKEIELAGPNAHRIAIAQRMGAGGIKVLSVGGGGGGQMINLPESILNDPPPPAPPEPPVAPPTPQPEPPQQPPGTASPQGQQPAQPATPPQTPPAPPNQPAGAQRRPRKNRRGQQQP